MSHVNPFCAFALVTWYQVAQIRRVMIDDATTRGRFDNYLFFSDLAYCVCGEQQYRLARKEGREHNIYTTSTVQVARFIMCGAIHFTNKSTLACSPATREDG